MRQPLFWLFGALLSILIGKTMAGLLDLNRVLNVNALIGSGNHNGGNGVEKNEVEKNQNYNQRIRRKRRGDDDD